MPPMDRVRLPPGPSGLLLDLVSQMRFGVKAVYTDGTGVTKVNWSPATIGLIPAPLVTLTSVTPAACAGVTAWISVSDSTLILAAGVPLNVTELTLLQYPEPVMNTVVPPVVGPEFGETFPTVEAPL